MPPKDLHTVGLQDLLETPLEDADWIVEEMVPVGLTLLAGTPKVGKSWLVLMLAICVSCGDAFLEHATVKGGVLCLFLEDTFKRIQKRAQHIVDVANNDLQLAVRADKIDDGLIIQLKHFFNDHPNTKLVIIDTLQTVRNTRSNNVYSDDYCDLTALKRFADERNIAMVLIHHTRKMSDTANVFNMVSGSNGLMGSADATMILAKGNFFDGKATLSITGRDIDSAEFKLAFNDCKWVLVEQTSREELKERDVPACVLTVLDFMANRAANWEGTATQLLEEAGLDDVKANALPKYLNEHSAFMLERGVRYQIRRTSSARLVKLVKTEGQAAL